MVLVVVQQCEYTLKMVKMVNFMLHIFYHKKIRQKSGGKSKTKARCLLSRSLQLINFYYLIHLDNRILFGAKKN